VTLGHAELVVDARCTLGEGPVWSPRDRALFWTDIEGARLWRYGAIDGGMESWTVPDRLGSFALCASGRVLLGLAKGLYWARLDAAPDEALEVTLAVPVESDLPSTRINDGRTDRAGNFVFGTLNEAAGRAPLGRFYQFSAAHGLRRLNLEAVAISNSLCFSPDGATIYFCDSPQRVIQRGDYDAAAARVSNVREFVRLTDADGLPDGSTIDREGCLWNAAWGSARVRRYTLDGAVDQEVAIPARNPTSVAFGGEVLSDLFVTSSRQEMTDEELRAMPGAGGLFRVATSARGLLDRLFQDQ
jgi:L-arabinonolactonase